MYITEKWISKTILGVVTVFACSSGIAAQSRVYNFNFRFAPSAPDEARDLFNAGLEFYDQNRFAEAEKKFRDVVVRFPKNSIADRADYYFIRTLAQLGKKGEAVTRINSFARSYPQSRWRTDVEELRISLTNQIPPAAITLLLGPASPPSPLPPSPPAPPSPPRPFGAIFVQNAQGRIEVTDPELSLQQEILRAVFRNNPDRAIEIATERLKKDPADPIVLSSLNMVAGSRSAQALPILTAIARSSTNAKARKDAIFWIGQSRGEKESVVDTLVDLLPVIAVDDFDAVTFALGQMRSERALNALATIARDRNKSEKARNDAIFWISQARSANNRTSNLEDVYKNSMDNSKIRLQVLFALSQTRLPEAVTVLGNIASADPDIEVRKQAVFWLGQIRTPAAAQALENLLGKK